MTRDKIPYVILGISPVAESINCRMCINCQVRKLPVPYRASYCYRANTLNDKLIIHYSGDRHDRFNE